MSFSFVRDNPALAVGLLAAPVAGAFAGGAQYREDGTRSGFPPEERMNHAIFRGVQAAEGVAALGFVANVAYRHSGPLGSLAKATPGFIGRRVAAPFTAAEASRAAYLSRGASPTMAAVRGYGESARLMGGAGAILGGLIGEHYDHPVLGAMAGTAAGFGVKAALGMHRVWAGMPPVNVVDRAISGVLSPVRKFGLVGALSVAGYMAINESKQAQVQSEAFASPDGVGGISYSDMPVAQDSGIQDRLRRLGATGDLNFGLHNKRH